MSVLSYPLPRPDAHTQPYWDAAKEGQLRYQQCRACACVQLIPRSLCESCQSSELEWKTSKGIGRVLTFTTVHRAALPVFKQKVPYVIAIVDMEEGFRVMANARPEVQDEIDIGTTVSIGFEEVDGMALPIIESIPEAAI